MKFIRNVFAAMVGFFLAIVVLAALTFFMMLIFASMGTDGVKINKEAVLKLDVNYAVMDKATSTSNFMNPFEDDKKLSLQQVLETIRAAKDDDRIKGIYYHTLGTGTGFAHLESIRDALIDFKESGKFIITYGENISKKDYYLASVADYITANPEGQVEFIGFKTERMFYKGLMEKLEIEPAIIWAGQFKSGTEPYRLKEMSDPARQQVTEFLENFYNIYLDNIGLSIGKSKEELRVMANEGLIRMPKDALEHGLITDLMYYDQVVDLLKDKSGIEKDEDLQLVGLESYHDSEVVGKKSKSKNKIVVLRAEGDIIGGSSSDNIASETYLKLIRKIRKDEDVKAIVLRVNSGGGSALASEIIYRELKLAKEENGLPLVASMGNVAASGGYYILCHADSILAQPNTLTGSIGVYGIIPNFEKFLENKLGITTDGVKTGKFADILSPYREMTEEERAIIQELVDDTYSDFTTRCAEGRNMSVEEIHEIAQGRVWSGEDALANGLIDKIGELDDAISIASNMAELDKYQVVYYPKEKSSFDEWIEKINQIHVERSLKNELGQFYQAFAQIRELKNLEGIQARMPMFEIK